ncbi:MAG: hypothetical protein KIT80_01910 [Chitinophagaceae bacterium]|nr:hypothetical protein [Chitinophagaceae bacterium]MCW5925639.1 hypothetical protein [Chitinophagaceae bacterium]
MMNNYTALPEYPLMETTPGAYQHSGNDSQTDCLMDGDECLLTLQERLSIITSGWRSGDVHLPFPIPD